MEGLSNPRTATTEDMLVPPSSPNDPTEPPPAEVAGARTVSEAGGMVSDSEHAATANSRTGSTTVMATAETTSFFASTNSRNENDKADVSQDEDDEDDEFEYEYEEDDDMAFSGFLVTTTQQEQRPAPSSSSSSSSVRENGTSHDESSARMIQDDDNVQQEAQGGAQSRSSKWKEPSREAVNMSLRAERETTGGKRRLAADLYKIMMAAEHSADAGFALEPKSDDAMNVWTLKLFQFDEDSNLAQDMMVLGVDHVELEMTFPDQYPFEPPFVRVVRPRFQRQTGFVMNGALCMELLTKDGWNPVNDIESVIVSIRSLMAVGDGRLAAAVEMPEAKRKALLEQAKQNKEAGGAAAAASAEHFKRERSDSGEANKVSNVTEKPAKMSKAAAAANAGQYTKAEAESAYAHISDYHKKKGWDQSGWWAKKG